MKTWGRMFTAVVMLAVLSFAAANFIFRYMKAPENGRPYRVEINRIAAQIEQDGFADVDLSECEYVYHVAEWSDNFFNVQSDYSVREIGGKLYRFDYSDKGSKGHLPLIIAINVILAVMTGTALAILFYIRGQILRPFARLTNIPYELSRGNLTLPLKESKSRFFGKFLWGIDLLRENIERQKQREMELQKEKKTLLLSLSHDIKTPLSAIKLYAKALSKNLYSDPERQHEIAENINQKADEIERYVSQIVTASREDFLYLDVRDGEFYLSDLIRSITAYYSEKLALMKTQFVVGEYKNCLLSGDLDRSEEVLQNVIENALKYGDGKRVELIFPEEESGVLVAVRNSGCTLDEADLPHVFESFWRGANAGNIHGSGLGLYICRQLMHRMGGEIFAEIDSGAITVTVVFVRA